MSDKTIITLPAGTLVYPHLNEPDNYGGKERFKTKVELPLDVGRPIAAQMKQIAKDGLSVAKFKKAKFPWKVDNEKGVVVFNFNSQHKPGLFDAKGKPIKADVQVGAGTVARVRIDAGAYDHESCGVSGWIRSVQILTLVEGHGGQDQWDDVSDKVDGAFDASEHNDTASEVDEFAGGEDEDDAKDETDALGAPASDASDF